MAERSIDERIRLWYEQFDDALQMTQRDFSYSHPMYHDTLEEAQRRFVDATDITAMRADSLARNPAEEVRDRLDASEARAAEALWGSRVPERDPTYAEQQAYEDAPYDRLEAMSAADVDDWDLEIDTSDPDMGQSWQEQLAVLDARLEALLEQGVAQEEERGVEW